MAKSTQEGFLISVSSSAGYFADKFSRKITIMLGKYINNLRHPTFPRLGLTCRLPFCVFLAVVVFSIGVIVQTAAKNASSIYGGINPYGIQS